MTKRSRTVGKTQDVRLRALRIARYRDQPFEVPGGFDPADGPWLAALDAGDHLIRSVRICRLTARGDDLWAWRRRVGVVGEIVDALLTDFANGGSAAVD
jgi:hypothetical protein